MKMKFAFVIATLLLSFILGVSAQTSDDTDVNAIYEKWRAVYAPCKQTEEEQIYRREAFFANYRIIIAHNSNPDNTYTLALNQFSDQTQDEFNARMLTPRSFSVEQHDENESSDEDETFRDELNIEIDGTCDSANNLDIKARLLASPPSSVDWRPKGAVTAVKNQGSCGSCWAFSTTGMLEGVQFLRGKGLTSLSEQQLLDCCGVKGYGCYGCNGAWPVWAVNYVKKYGILKSSAYPYVGHQTTCKINSPTSGFYVSQASYLPSTNNGLKKGIAKQPVSVAVDASNWFQYSSGVFNNCSSKKSKANHAVTAVGYTSSGVWIVKNSWGTGWGQTGYIYLKKGNTCGINNYALVAKI